MATFKDNPAFKEEFYSELLNARFYGPVSASDYHTSRFIAAQAQDLFASVGTSKEVLSAIVSKVLELCNSDKPVNTFRTDVGVLMANLQYRMKYPVDEECAIRMGAILTFAEGEDPNRVADAWTQKKMDMARQDPALYTFFLSKGLANLPSYAKLLDTLTDTQMTARREALSSLTPPSLSLIS